jgi:amidase
MALIKHHWGALSPLLDLTTGVFPVTKVDLEKDIIPKGWVPISDLDQKVMNYCKSLRESDEISAKNFLDGSPENHNNALIGLAVIGRRLEEEKVTSMMAEITRCLEKSIF